MRKRLLTMVGLVLVSAMTFGATRAAIRAAKRPAAPPPAYRIEVTSDPRIEVSRAVGGEGTIDVEAIAMVGDRYEPQDFVWYVKVGQPSATGWRVVWRELYDQQPLAVAAGRTRRAVFTEHLVMPPGKYGVEVGLMEVGSQVLDGWNQPTSQPVLSALADVVVR